MNSAKLLDQYGRSLTYLRISLTDRCNLRCTYCTPQHNFTHIHPREILTYEELLRICGLLAEMGLKKVRCTGGEPLVRQGALPFLERLSTIPGIEEVCLTTNGVLLEDSAQGLWDAGIRHINVSLDTLRPERFKSITGRDCFGKVWAGIMALLDLGFDKIKINSVVARGMNDDEIAALASLSQQYPIEVRFIEFMPVGHNKWGKQLVVEVAEMQSIIEEALGTLRPVASERHAGPARLFQLEGAKGKVGFISPLSQHFCSTCNRIRLTSDGRLRLCLFSDFEYDVKGIMRRGASDQALSRFLLDAVQNKPENYSPESKTGCPSCTRAMGTIGG